MPIGFNESEKLIFKNILTRIPFRVIFRYMKKLPVIFLIILASKLYSQEFWEPAQASIQIHEFGLFGYFSEETDDTRKIHSQSLINLSSAFKLNQFEIDFGMISNNRGTESLNYGITYFYNNEGSSPYLHYSRATNWILDKWKPSYYNDYKTGKKVTEYADSTVRDAAIFEIGYKVECHKVDFKYSFGFIQGLKSKSVLLAPTPIFQIGLSLNLWRTRKLDNARFF